MLNMYTTVQMSDFIPIVIPFGKIICYGILLENLWRAWRQSLFG